MINLHTVPNLKSLCSPITKVRKAMQNVELGGLRWSGLNKGHQQHNDVHMTLCLILLETNICISAIC